MIYLDNNATTPVDPNVLEAMLPYFSEHFGNAASRGHAYGWRADSAVELARERIAAAVGAEPAEIIFTSGATESINLALKGTAATYNSRGNRLVTAATEHNAVLDTLRSLERRGYHVTVLPVDSEGFVDPEAVRAAIDDRTIAVSIMHANNEIGTINDIAAIGTICRERGVFFHTDASQSFGKIGFDVNAMSVDLASFSAHKLYGPKGCGALYVRRRRPRVVLEPQIEGGGHERGLRSGTLNVPGIVGFGTAAAIAMEEMGREAPETLRLALTLLEGLTAALPDLRIEINGPDPRRSVGKRLPGNLNVAFHGIDSALLIAELRDVAVSTGSACTSSSPAPSHVLKAIGRSDELAGSSIRFGIGRFTTAEEIGKAIERVAGAIARVRELRPGGI